MTLQFTTAAEESVGNGIKLLVHAPAGMGKTLLVATLPNPVLISAESGLLSLTPGNIKKIWEPTELPFTTDIPVIKITNIHDLNEAFDWCSSSEAEGYDIAIDSLSEIMEQILSAAKEANKDGRAAYGDLNEKGVELIKSFRDLPGKNVYMSAKQMPIKDDFANITKYGPMMPGNRLGAGIGYYFDEVYAMRTGTDEEGNAFRYFQTQPDIQYEAKCRSGALDAMEYPHLGSIIEKIRQHATVE